MMGSDGIGMNQFVHAAAVRVPVSDAGPPHEALERNKSDSGDATCGGWKLDFKGLVTN